jgi:Zn-dependent M16 (insulinase) family peptidase
MAGHDVSQSQHIHGFIVDKTEDITELRSKAVLCTHRKTGCRLIHLHNDDPNNLFCIGFRTPVFDNTGVAHILEHSVLSGSRKFPLKDPFKELLKGSLQTFLNALTYPDKTMYPVSSQVEADFFNLVDVYCDAVLNPLLTETTFYQEGWHFDVEDDDAAIGIKGIVYNEMKGVYSDFRSHVARKTMSALFPDTTYCFESGGDPEDIPSLTYENFKAFHKSFYHPSNAYIFLYGNIPTRTTLQFLHKKYLAGFKRCAVDSEIKQQSLWHEPRRVDITAPSAKEDNGSASVIVSWIFGNATDARTGLLGPILSRYYIGTESSPLRRALIDSGLGEDIDDMTGFDLDLVQGFFSAGLRKTRPEHAERIEKLILDTLRSDIERGMDEQLLEGAIRQTEFHLREITDSGHFPYNLMLAERCFRSWLYGGDPLAHVRFERPLSLLKKEKAKGASFFAEACRKSLLENPHRLVSVVTASSAMGKALGKLTEKQAYRLTQSFGLKEKRMYKDLTERLKNYQKEPPSPQALAALGRLNKSDVPKENREVPTTIDHIDGIRIYAHPVFSSGIVYLDIGFDLSALGRELLMYFPLYSEIISRCGAAGLSYMEMAKRISLSTGALSCSDMCSVMADTIEQIACRALFHSKALSERCDEMIDIMRDLLCEPDLGDEKLIKDTLVEMRNSFNAAVIRNGHLFAASNAASRCTKSRYLTELLDGITQLRFLDGLVKQHETGEIAHRLKELHKIIVTKHNCFLSLTTDTPQQYYKALERLAGHIGGNRPKAAAIRFPRRRLEHAAGIEISSSVNFVAKAWRLDDVAPEQTGLLMLMAKYLSTGFLWEKVRVEGGAYGGKAFSTSAHPSFVCASYRDPNLSKTLQNFDKALEHVAAGLDTDDVDKSIIGTIGVIDHPKAPHSKGLSETIALVCGRSQQYRRRVRAAVLSATPHSLAGIAKRMRDDPSTAIAIVGSANAFDRARTEGVNLLREPLLPQ